MSDYYKWTQSHRKGWETYEYRMDTIMLQVSRMSYPESDTWRAALFTESVAADVGRPCKDVEAAKRQAMKAAQKWLLRDVAKVSRVLNRGEK